MITWLIKWITPASTRIWSLVAIVFGALLLVVKGQGNKIQKQKIENQNLESEVQKAERLQNVQINTDRDAALSRMREHNQVRKD
jgi:hypothetical protein